MADTRPQSPDELFAIEGLLDDDELAMRDTVRRFCDDRVRPHLADWFEQAAIPARELARELGGLGVLGMHLHGYGCAGTSATAYGLACLELEAADSGIRSLVSVQGSLAMFAIWRYGSEEHKQQWLPGMAAGEALGCFGLTEPDTGSDASNLKTRAEKIDGGWRINGGKMWISLGNYAKLAMIFAQTDPSKKHKGLACFLVPTGADGFSSQEIHGKLGLKGSDTAELSLDGVEVPDDALMGEIGDGFKIAMSALDSGRYSVAAGCVGICQASLDASVAYSKERRQFDRPIASFQLVQEMIADMVVQTEAARGLVWRAGWLKDQGRPNTTETSIAKLYATEAAVECANKAIQVHGGSGYVDDYPVERYLRDARVTTLYEGTSQIQKLIIGRAVTGENALVP
jgi:glutaryl-CoA dehydrogenase